MPKNSEVHSGTKAVLKVILLKVEDLLKIYSSVSNIYKQSAKKEKYEKNIIHLKIIKKELEGHISSNSPIFPKELKDIQSALVLAQKGISEILDEAVQNKALQSKLSVIEKEVGLSLSELNKKVVNSTKLLRSVAKEEGITGLYIPRHVKSTMSTAGKFLLHSIAGPFAPLIHMASVGIHRAYGAGKAFFSKTAQKRLAKSLGAEKMHPIFSRSIGEYVSEKIHGIPGKPSFDWLGREIPAISREAAGHSALAVHCLDMKGLFNFFDKKAFKARWTRSVYLLLKKLARSGMGKESFITEAGMAGLTKLKGLLSTIGHGFMMFASFLTLLGAAISGWKIGKWIRSVTSIDKFLSGDNGIFTRMAKGFYFLKDKVFPKIGKFFKSVGWFLKQLLLLGTPIGMLIRLSSKVAKFFHAKTPSEKVEPSGKTIIKPEKEIKTPSEKVEPSGKTIIKPEKEIKTFKPIIQSSGTTIKSEKIVTQIKKAAEKIKIVTVQTSSAYKDSFSRALKDLKDVVAGLPEKIKQQPVVVGGTSQNKVYNSNDTLTEIFAFGMAKEDD